MTEDELRVRLDLEARRWPSRVQFCLKYGISRSHFVEFLQGKRGPPPTMLEALHIETIYIQRRRPKEDK